MTSTQDIKELETALRVILAEVLPIDDLRMIAVQQRELLEKMDKLNATVYGNGKEGLTTTVSRLDRWMISVQNILNEILKWGLLLLIGGGGGWLVYLASSHNMIVK